MKNKLLLFLVLAGITFSSFNNDDDPVANSAITSTHINLIMQASNEQNKE